jgi:hypothetical protein
MAEVPQKPLMMMLRDPVVVAAARAETCHQLVRSSRSCCDYCSGLTGSWEMSSRKGMAVREDARGNRPLTTMIVSEIAK